MKLIGLILAYASLLSSVAYAQTLPPQAASPPSTVQVTKTATPAAELEKDRVLKAKLKIWTSTLSQVAKQENTCLFFDVAPDDVAPNATYDRPVGVPAMRALATASRRTWKQVDGVQTFTRAEDPKAPNSDYDDINQVVSWVNNLSPDQKSALIKEQLSFAQLDPQSRALMSRMAGWMPDMSFVLLEKGNQVGVGLELAPRITYTDPKTGKRVTQEIGGRAHSVKVPSSDTHSLFEPLNPAEAGPLDFGTGTIWTLSDIVDKAQAAFRVRYVPVDGRVAGTWYFVSGMMTRQTFEDVLGQATAIPPLRPRLAKQVDRAAARALLDDPEFQDQQIDVTDLRMRLMMTNSRDIQALIDRFGPTETLSAQDFLAGKTVTLSELTDGKPGLTAYLARLGLAPDAPIVLSASPALVIKADGEHLASGSYGTMNGQPVPVTSPNWTSVGLW